MGQDLPGNRILELEALSNRLFHHEDEKPGITIKEAINISNSAFPSEKFSPHDIFNELMASISDLSKQQENVLNPNLLSTALCASIAIMCRESSKEIGPFYILWGKYIHNSIKFSMVQIHKENLSEDEYYQLLKESKELALRNGWSDMEALRQFHDYFFCDGWYLFPEQAQYYPKPIGSNDLNLYQLVTNHFLLSMPHDFTLMELFNLLFEETNELKDELNSKKKVRLQGAFEAADIFIYLLHIATKMNLNVSELLQSQTTL